MNKEIIAIGWKEYLAQVMPFLNGTDGGHVCITGQPGSGWRKFANIMKRQIPLEFDNTDMITIFGGNPAAQTVEDILRQFEQIPRIKGKLPVHLREGKNPCSLERGKLSCQIINREKSLFEMAAERFARTQTILNQLESQEYTSRLIIFIYGCHALSESVARWFWAEFWNSLKHFRERGNFCLISVCESDKSLCTHRDYKLIPKFRLQLAGSYTDANFNLAVSDMAEHIRNITGESIETAQIRSDTLLMEWDANPSRANSGFPIILMKLRDRTNGQKSGNT